MRATEAMTATAAKIGIVRWCFFGEFVGEGEDGEGSDGGDGGSEGGGETGGAGGPTGAR